MKKMITLLVAGILLNCAIPAYALYIIDTGIPNTPSVNNGQMIDRFDNSRFQWMAGQFSLNGTYAITSIEAYFDTTLYAGDVTISVYGDNSNYPDMADVISRDAFYMTGGNGWYGILDENFTLSPGTYWVGFEVRDPSLYRGKLSIDLSSPQVPLANPLSQYYVANAGQPNYGPGALPFSVRIGGTDQANGIVPEPATLALLASGIGGLLLRRKKG